MIFYAVVVLFVVIGRVGAIDVLAAWVFVAGRVVHTLVQTLTDDVPLRGRVFLINFVAVVVLVGAYHNAGTGRRGPAVAVVKEYKEFRMADPARRVVLVSRPWASRRPRISAPRIFPFRTPGPGEVLLRTLWLSLDPYMRGRMSDAPSYAHRSRSAGRWSAAPSAR